MASYYSILNDYTEKLEPSSKKILTPLFNDLHKIESKIKEFKSVTDNQTDELFNITNNLADNILMDNSDVKDIMNDIKEKWSEQIKKHRDIHTAISKFGKTTDKIFCDQIDHLNSYFIKTTNPKNLSENSKLYFESVNSLIFDYLLRIGRVDVASVFLEEEKVNLSAEEKQMLDEVSVIIKSMRNYQFEPLSQWIDNNRDCMTESLIIKFQYIISKLEFLNSLSNQPANFNLLINCAKRMAIYARFFQPDFEYLMGSLAFIQNPERIKQFYAELFEKQPDRCTDTAYDNYDGCARTCDGDGDDDEDEDTQAMDCSSSMACSFVTENIIRSLYYQHYLDELVAMFSEQVCAIKQATQSDPLLTLFTSGIRNIAEFFNHDQIFKKLYIYNKVEDFPLTVQKHEQEFYHSIFHCPVDKTVVCGDNAVLRLKCGHAISKNAFNQLRKNEQKTKMKCPYCPTETKTNEVLTLVL